MLTLQIFTFSALRICFMWLFVVQFYSACNVHIFLWTIKSNCQQVLVIGEAIVMTEIWRICINKYTKISTIESCNTNVTTNISPLFDMLTEILVFLVT